MDLCHGYDRNCQKKIKKWKYENVSFNPVTKGKCLIFYNLMLHDSDTRNLMPLIEQETLSTAILTSVAWERWSDVRRSRDDGIGTTAGLELSQPARQCDDKPTESVGSKLLRLCGLSRYGESREDRGTVTLSQRKENFMAAIITNFLYMLFHRKRIN